MSKQQIADLRMQGYAYLNAANWYAKVLAQQENEAKAAKRTTKIRVVKAEPTVAEMEAELERLIALRNTKL